MPKSAEELFAAALELTSPADRAALLDRECSGNAALRAEVESLLAAHEQAGTFINEPAASQATVRVSTSHIAPLTEKPGDKIDRYKLLQKIGEGGCGVVYMAEQEQPVRRRIALKVIKLGMDTRSVIARFEAERQALALMDHPNIAKVHDGGATETGRPYFVMELVKGIKITDYCDQNNLSTRERLGLFTQVCQAIQHAHQKGIIHRDIKPSNILVTLHDGVPVPKVIDFGIAKATEGRLTDKTFFTEFQQFLGTPAYMSPEQAGMSGLDIDTRTDLYALGVLLYELLTGKTPFDASELLKAGLDEMRRIIREQEPARPSTRLTALTNEELTTVAKHRQSEPPKLINLVRGDLDWIVMKCLEKDRSRRYETTNGLSMDVHRHLNSEPVAARPPSNLYRFQKLARRNKLAFGAAVAVATVLALGVVVSTWQAVRATRARHEANRQRTAAEQATRAADNAQRASAEQLVHLSGWQSCEAGDSLDALVWFTEALYLSQNNPTSEELQRIRLGCLLQNTPKLVQVGFLAGPAKDVEFSPDGRQLVTACEDGTVRVWDSITGKAITPPIQHRGTVRQATFSPDGRLILTASGQWRDATRQEGEARIWNAATGEPTTPALRHTKMVWSASFSPDGRRVVTAGFDGIARVWDAMTGQALTPPMDHRGVLIYGAWFSPDGKRIITKGTYNDARVWDASTGLPALPPLVHQSYVAGAGFSPDGRLIVTIDTQAVLRLWDAATGEGMFPPVTENRVSSQGAVSNQVVFSPDSRYVAAAYDDGTARIFYAETGKSIRSVQSRDRVTCVSFSPDGRYLLTGSEDGTARVWDASSGAPLTPWLKHNGPVSQAVFDPDGRRVATASADRSFRVWDLTECMTSKTPRFMSIGESALSPDFRRIVASKEVSEEGIGRFSRTVMCDAATGETLFPFDCGTNHLPCFLRKPVFSRDGRLVAAATKPDGAINGTIDGRIMQLQVWDAATGRAIGQPVGHEDEITRIEFSPDGRLVASASRNRTVKVSEATSGQLVFPPLLHQAQVQYATFSPDRRLLATVAFDEIRVCSATTGQPALPPLKEDSTVWKVAFSPDSRQLVSANNDGTARVWDLASGKPAAPPVRHDKFVLSSVFSPDGRQIATCSADKTARIWDAATCQPVTPGLRHAQEARWATFSPDGHRLLTVTWDQVQLWDASTGEPITPPLKQDGPIFHASFNPNGAGLIVAASEQVRFIRLPKEERPIQDLTLIAQLLSAHRLQPGLGLRPVESSELETTWQTLREKYPAEFTSVPNSDFAWHEHEAVICEGDRQWFAALVHLEKMSAASPADDRLRERRDKVRALLKQYEAGMESFRERRRENRRLAGVKIDPTRIPTTTVSGKVRGTNFVCAKATLYERSLFLAPAEDGFDLRISFNLEGAGTLSGRTFTASVSALSDTPMYSRDVPEIIVSYYQVPRMRSTADPTPKDIGYRKTYRTGFAVYLQFGQIADGQVTGRIDLRLPDVEGSSIAGVFTAQDDRIRAEADLLHSRGEGSASFGQWKEAAENFAKAVELQPTNHAFYHALAPLLVQSGDLEGYRRVRQSILTRFSGSNDPIVAERMAKDCLILPWSGADLDTVAKMADTAVAADTNHWAMTWFQFAKGLAEYRQGRFVSAVEWTQKVLAKAGEQPVRDVQAYMVLAMAQHQLKHLGEARAALAKGVEIAETKLPKLNSGDLGGGWSDWIIANILMGEAKSLIEGTPAAASDPPKQK